MRNILISANASEMIGDIGGEDKARYVELIKYALLLSPRFRFWFFILSCRNILLKVLW